ncbi:MAG: hypothetical protein A6F70_03160 [Cycloclasticus sp. symbiont of Bathymodiolus heckerae]|nr:MAG: hypothetical protein A6F70_03160 [Cycloclasticus sp. symbiont of Bathymodiolus heckerae]
MNYKRVFFAGYFLDSEDKLKYTRLFDCEKYIFLESSGLYSKYNDELLKYFPMNLFHMRGLRIWNMLFKRVELEPTFIDLYKRDLKIFKLSYLKDPLPGGKKTFALFVYWVFRRAFKSRFSFVSALNVFRTIVSRGKSRNQCGFKEKGKSYHHIQSLKMLAFRLSFINGYGYVKKIPDELDASKNDLLILWGSHNSGARLLLDGMKKKGVDCFISEYGELPGTFSLNKEGIFGDSQIAKNWNKISTASPMLDVKSYINRIEGSQSSSRSNSKDDQMLTLYRVLYEPKVLTKKVVYVSGVELIASGHLFDKEFVTPRMVNANEMLLRHVLSNFSVDEYIIFYKDHPLMQKNYEALTLNSTDFKGVFFVNTINVDNLISMADITITLPSKVIMTCLMYRKTVYAYGNFSIPETIPALGYYTGRNVADIKQVVDAGCNSINSGLYPEIVSKLLQEYLICHQSPLFESYDSLVEKQKIENIIDSQLTIDK